MSDHHLTTRSADVGAGTGARQFFLGVLLGLCPLVLATEGILAWGRFGEVGVGLFLLLMVEGLALTGVDALAVTPLLLIPRTRRIGLGVAAGVVITGAVAVYLTTHGFWNGLFD